MWQNMQLSKILIYGGSFDPIHVGHTNMLNIAIDKIKPNICYIVPNYLSPNKDTTYSSVEQRIDMINLAIVGMNNVVISDYEIKQNQSVKTIDTIQYFKSIHPNSEIYLLIGSDQLRNFKNWYKYEEILNIVKLVVYPRDNNLMSVNDFEYLLLNGPILNISSSSIREEVRYFELNEKVLSYINDNGLYAIERIKKYESEKRYNHSLRVAYMARELIKMYNPNLANLAFTAGIYHDIAKEMEPDFQVYVAKNILSINNFESYKVLHGYIGTYILKSKYLFTNKLILDAINRHTLPYEHYKNEPNLLDKVLYVADKLEPNRTDDDVFGKSIEYYRELAKTDIDKCFNELYSWLQLNLRGNK